MIPITTVYLMPTHLCNNNCSYCYIPAEEKAKDGDPTFFINFVEKYISYIKNLSIKNPQLRFLGGEPYIKANLIKKLSIDFAEAFSDGMVVINTNGTLLTDEIIDNFLQYKNIYHIISLDGPIFIHNARRKSKNFIDGYNKTIKSIQMLKQKHLPVYINMVLDYDNIDYLNDFIKLIKFDFGLNDLSISLRYSNNSPLSKEDKLFLLCKSYQLADKYNIIISGHHRLMLGNIISELKCKAGQKTIVLSCDQKIYNCQRFIGNNKKCSNINLGQDIKSISNYNNCEVDCYNKDEIWLGEKIYKLYLTNYPYYLNVNELDKILFGVI